MRSCPITSLMGRRPLTRPWTCCRISSWYGLLTPSAVCSSHLAQCSIGEAPWACIRSANCCVLVVAFLLGMQGLSKESSGGGQWHLVHNSSGLQLLRQASISSLPACLDHSEVEHRKILLQSVTSRLQQPISLSADCHCSTALHTQLAKLCHQPCLFWTGSSDGRTAPSTIYCTAHSTAATQLDAQAQYRPLTAAMPSPTATLLVTVTNINSRAGQARKQSHVQLITDLLHMHLALARLHSDYHCCPTIADCWRVQCRGKLSLLLCSC